MGPDPILMGILNVTPDSFSDSGEFFGVDAAVVQAETMLDEGAQIVDVGGESTRPGSDPVSEEEELRRVLPAVRGILEVRPGALVSIDTYRASTAEAALDAGAHLVNDVTALSDPRMAGLVAERGCPIILMHMLGEPKTMQKDPRYVDVVREVRDFLAMRAECATRAGVAHGDIILDPGIGFGKTYEHNLALLNRLGALVELGFPVLVGASRKSFLGKIVGSDSSKDRLFGTVATSVLAYERGAKLFRVHDVRANKEALAVAAAVGQA
ncbi:MAG: dihydropteroate synthase [Actinomycetota bacterium]|nr:dihydropteroate synthase [Actinomycetota bacterium]